MRLRSTGAFSAAVPVIIFADIAWQAERVRNGEPGVLTSEAVIRFKTTSGTTGKPSFMPVTRRGWNAAARVCLLWLRRALRDHPRFLD